MFAPMIEGPETSREAFSMFGGYNKNLTITEGEWNDENNLSSMFFPLMAPMRDSWILYNKVTPIDVDEDEDPQSITRVPVGITAVNSMTYGYSVISVDSDGVVYIGNIPVGPAESEDVIHVDPTTPKQYVLMGSYLVVFPDNVYFNINDISDQGYLFVSSSIKNLTGYPCHKDGTIISTYTTSTTAPANPSDGDIWLDTSSEKHEYKQWYASSSMWLSMPDVYVRLEDNTPHSLNIFTVDYKEGDGITLDIPSITQTSQSLIDQVAALNGSNIIEKVAPLYIVVTGIVDAQFTSDGTNTCHFERKVPSMDYVIECQNRLWGCKYGTVDGEHINELYCSKLGDFRNWEVYEGVSTDSWRASVGLPGPWTGAAVYDGRPTFFKKDCIYKIYISGTGAHQIATTEGPGVREGCWQSLAICGSVLFYVSNSGVMAYTGTTPLRVSDNVDTDKAYNAVATVWRKYYILTFFPEFNKALTFTYDTELKVWHRITIPFPISYVNPSGDFLTWQDSEGNVWNNDPTGKTISSLETGTSFNGDWYAVSGVIGLDYTDNKYLSRFEFRINLFKGAWCELFIEYDSDGQWHSKGRLYRSGLQSFILPVVPRRCDHCRIKFVGHGDFRMYSISKVLEVGSDVV